ncbi:MAG: hypothetical protein D6705_17060 [Deltaproteobacteria bacterium]|nr:MAG: hypothetical protein D6705_17060 [Deltaproteobacteria bacterium]
MADPSDRQLADGQLATYWVVPLRDTVVFPDVTTSFTVGRSFSVLAFKMAYATSDRLLYLVLQREPGVDAPTRADLHGCGTVAQIINRITLPNRHVRVEVRGLQRARMVDVHDRDGATLASVKLEPPAESRPIDSAIREVVAALLRTTAEHLVGRGDAAALAGLGVSDTGEVEFDVRGLERLTYALAASLDFPTPHKQALLDLDDPVQRLAEIADMLARSGGRDPSRRDPSRRS